MFGGFKVNQEFSCPVVWKSFPPRSIPITPRPQTANDAMQWSTIALQWWLDGWCLSNAESLSQECCIPEAVHSIALEQFEQCCFLGM